MDNDLVYIEAMLERTMGDRLLAITLFKKLFLEFPRQIIEIEIAVEQSQIIVARKKLHKLQGSLSFCGFFELKSLAKNLEERLLNNDLDRVVEDLSVLVQEITLFNGLQEKILQQLR